jgi:hypothetical protein
MNTLPYQQAFERIRAEYMEMPGMRLTLQQAQRLAGADSSVCRLALDGLVRENFLRMEPDGSYARLTEGTFWRLRSRSGSVFECGIYNDDTWMDVRISLGADTMHSELVPTIERGRQIAERWRVAILAKGGVEELPS